MKIVAIFIFAIATLSGCGMPSAYDHRQDIALATLYGITSGKTNNTAAVPDSKEVNSTFTGALNGKFPRGTPIKKLQEFVLMLGGKCSDSHLTNGMECSIPDYFMFCFSSKILITAIYGEQGIERIVARKDFVAC